jgi:hypothetical protein
MGCAASTARPLRRIAVPVRHGVSRRMHRRPSTHGQRPGLRWDRHLHRPTAFGDLANLKAFDFALAPVWVWTVSYIVYPALAVLIVRSVWRRGGFDVAEDPADSPIPLSGRIALQGTVAVFGLVGMMLLVERERMVRVWPWKVSNGLAQFYAAPALAIAFCAWRYSRRTRWTSLRAFAPALLALGVATLASSIRHRAVLGATDLSLVTWYTVFGFVTAFGLVATVASWRPRPVR